MGHDQVPVGDEPRRPHGRRLMLAAGTVGIVLTGALGGWAAWGSSQPGPSPAPTEVAAGASPTTRGTTAPGAAAPARAPASEAGGIGTAAPRTPGQAKRACFGAALGRAGAGTRSAWSKRYGQDRLTMPTEPDVASATPAQRAGATELLQQTRAAIAPYADLSTAAQAGYDLEAALTRVRARRGVPEDRMPKMLHVPNLAAFCDGKVLDPAVPEVLMYAREAGGWKLAGAMFTAGQVFPKAPPVPGGPITRWHYHPVGARASGLMMHVFVGTGRDLAAAFATTMPGMPNDERQMTAMGGD